MASASLDSFPPNGKIKNSISWFYSNCFDDIDLELALVDIVYHPCFCFHVALPDFVIEIVLLIYNIS